MNAAGGRRVLVIEQGGRGGVADYTAQLVVALAGAGAQVTLATAADHRYGEPAGVTVRPVFHYLRGERGLSRAVRARGLGPAINGLRFLLALPRLAMLAARAEIVHSQGFERRGIGLLAVICMRLTGTPIVHTEHSAFDRTPAFPWARLLARRLTGRLVARTIVHTEADRERLAPTLGRDALVVIPHGEYGGLASSGGQADRAAARAALGFAPDSPVTLAFGQLRRDKGLGDLVAAVARVPELQLLIGGQDAGGLSEVRARLGDLGDRVRIREGFLEMHEAAELFAAADTVALPYQESSQSGVLLLAYGFARPVVVYPRGGMVEAVIDGETGWICRAADPDALAQALADSVRAGAEECARRGRAGQELSHERFAWPVIARRTIAVYEEVLDRA